MYCTMVSTAPAIERHHGGDHGGVGAENATHTETENNLSGFQKGERMTRVRWWCSASVTFP